MFEYMAVGQNQWYHFGVGAPPMLVDFSWGLGCSLGVRDFDPWPHIYIYIYIHTHACMRYKYMHIQNIYIYALRPPRSTF